MLLAGPHCIQYMKCQMSPFSITRRMHTPTPLGRSHALHCYYYRRHAEEARLNDGLDYDAGKIDEKKPTNQPSPLRPT